MKWIVVAGLATGCAGDTSASGTETDSGTGGSGTTMPTTSPPETGALTTSAMTMGGTADGSTTGSADSGTSATTGADSATTSGGTTSEGTTGTTGGGSSTGGTSIGPVCAEACTQDSDCTIDGMDAGFVCGESSGLCLLGCTADIECIAVVSGWISNPCDTDVDCTDGACVDVDGFGLCASLPDPTTGCANPSLSDFMTDDTDGSTVTVCAVADIECGDVLGDPSCVSTAPPATCTALECPDPLTCDDSAPACNCTSAMDCSDAYTPQFDNSTQDCIEV